MTETKCKPCEAKSLLPVMASEDYASKRLAICNQCEHADGDTCSIVEEKHPGKSSISHGVVRQGIKCPLPEPKWTEAPMQCPACRRGDQIVPEKVGKCKWCVLRESVTGRPRSRPTNSFAIPRSRPTTHHGQRSSFTASGKPQWVSAQQLAYDTQTLASMLPHDVDVIIGVSRSGLDVATMVSKYLQLPLYAFRQSMGDVITVGSGWRLGLHPRAENRESMKAVVIDDTVMTGNSMKSIDALVRKQFKEIITAAIYVNPLAKRKPDLWVHDLGWPHLLEWNIFNSVLSHNMAVDFDGILCYDCPPGSDDDGPRYLDFIRNARPLYMPRKVPIPMIVTARIEKYRAETLEWLKRHRIQTHNLVMHPAKTLAERRKDDIAAFKAQHYLNWSKHYKPRPAPLGFIESEDGQARRIASITGLMTICPSSGGVYTE